MGVMNVTPDSFSDGGELATYAQFLARLKSFGNVDAIDLGAESTAPMNAPISADEEWHRIEPVLKWIRDLNLTVSFDTYHPATVHRLVKCWKDLRRPQPFIWNDVSGHFDHHVTDFLREGEQFHYVFCHNLAPRRSLTGAHMEYVREKLDLADHFWQKHHPRVIFDPCLGFSKTYEQNWWILEHFAEVQGTLGHDRWLVGFSRKSFLRRKYDLTLEQRDELDRVHVQEFKRLSHSWQGEVWIRTHRPELLEF
jgi:dihydropteroate synthase